MFYKHFLFLFTDLRKIDVDCITLGQYMQPTKRHIKVSLTELVDT